MSKQAADGGRLLRTGLPLARRTLPLRSRRRWLLVGWLLRLTLGDRGIRLLVVWLLHSLSRLLSRRRLRRLLLLLLLRLSRRSIVRRRLWLLRLHYLRLLWLSRGSRRLLWSIRRACRSLWLIRARLLLLRGSRLLRH